jgi:excisionase family DNA binding protein
LGPQRLFSDAGPNTKVFSAAWLELYWVKHMIIQFPRSGEHPKGRSVLRLKKDSFLTTQDVARWLGSSQRTVTDLVQRWHDTGGQEGIPGFKVGRAWRFDAERLEAWVTEKQLPTTRPSVVHKIKKTTAVG